MFWCRCRRPRAHRPPRPPGPRTPSRSKRPEACALDPEKQGPYLAAAVHLQRSCLRGPQHGGPPHGGLHPAGRHGTGAGCAGHRRRGHRPWTSSATLDCSLLNGLLHASHDTDEPGEAELRAGNHAMPRNAGTTRCIIISSLPKRAAPRALHDGRRCSTRAGAAARALHRPASSGKKPPTPAMWPHGWRWATMP